tara:strand:- start:1007 stop:1675 length:669 start_codon:yes stop_codon:yes gene_type:complete
VKITINNFSKFNPRSDLKSMPWLRLQNNFFDEEDFFDEDVNTTWLFIFLLCQCAQKVSGTLEMREKYLISKSKLTKKQFHDALSNLLAKSLISLETNESDRISTETCLTNEHNEHNVIERDRDRVFDFEAIYFEYPKKIGKAAGLKKLNSITMNQELYEEILQGCINYKNYIIENKTEAQYIKQFSSWVNQECWMDEMRISKRTIPDSFSEIRNQEEYKHEI